MKVYLETINEYLEKIGLFLIVGSWDGHGEFDRTTLELMTTREFDKRCTEARRRVNLQRGKN